MNEKQNIWLCRHGNRIDFVDPSWKGDDPHLSPDGVQQAKETGARLRGEGIGTIFASPFLRAIETAHHIANALDLSVRIEAGLCEWLNAEWFAQRPILKSLDELIARFPRIDPTHQSLVNPRFPETGDEATERAGEAARQLADQTRGDLLLVGHAHSVMGMATGLLRHPCSAPCHLCGLFKISRSAQREAILEIAGDNSHLSSP
ncbi:MAG: histidine phosphatase family protein [Verrucomicrobia bacterium]|nr:histidine phosphatase family protein [Kiritimatiellia bacterium]MCO6401765.1 histidine phosphatase family protein [Verrucomicrobiota bacterium]